MNIPHAGQLELPILLHDDIEHLDFDIECERPTCDNVAVYIVRWKLCNHYGKRDACACPMCTEREYTCNHCGARGKHTILERL